MDWASFIPSVVTGAFLGVFIARSRYWKQKYDRERRQRYDAESRYLTERENRQAAEEAIIQQQIQHNAKMNKQQFLMAGQIGTIAPADHMHDSLSWRGEKLTDDMIMRMIQGEFKNPQQHVIEEEP